MRRDTNIWYVFTSACVFKSVFNINQVWTLGVIECQHRQKYQKRERWAFLHLYIPRRPKLIVSLATKHTFRNHRAKDCQLDTWQFFLWGLSKWYWFAAFLGQSVASPPFLKKHDIWSIISCNRRRVCILRSFLSAQIPPVKSAMAKYILQLLSSSDRAP